VIVVCGPVLAGAEDTDDPSVIYLWLTDANYVRPFHVWVASNLSSVYPPSVHAYFKGRTICVEGILDMRGLAYGIYVDSPSAITEY
jgi:hypothetical protein